MSNLFHLYPYGTTTALITMGWITFEIVSRVVKAAIKRRIYGKYANEKNPESGEFYLEYYRRSQVIDIFRIIAFLFATSTIVIYLVPGAFSFLAIAAGAMIITFKDVILSFISFFYIVAHYKVGDTVGVTGARWEIIYIRFLNVGIVGRDENTEHTGTLHVIPNSRFILDAVQKEELSSSSYRCEQINIPYDSQEYSEPFDVFIGNLETFLSQNLKNRTMKQVGNYRSFAGTQYKLDYSYSNRGQLSIELRFIGKAGHLSDTTKKIVTFVESKRAKPIEEKSAG